MKRVAALYVSERGPYVRMRGVDPWPAKRDARKYAGPWPVVAHPPCAPWGRLRVVRLNFCAKWGKDPAAERDCGPIAVEHVRRFGGVLEHPASSALWAECGMPRPGFLPDRWGGWSVEVWQGAWGHSCPKRTWLYLVGVTAPVRVRWRVDPGGRVERQHSAARDLTPVEFATWLVGLARSVE